MSGPFSQAVELRGFERLIMDTIENPGLVHRLLAKTTELAKEQARRLSEAGCGINLYESWATIPLITPELFGEYVVPYNRQVIDMVRSDYNVEGPAVIMGGNINSLSVIEANEKAIEAVRRLAADVGMRLDLKDIDYTDSEIESMARSVYSHSSHIIKLTSARDVTPEDIKAMYMAIIKGTAKTS